jgi:hypothetical protein
LNEEAPYQHHDDIGGQEEEKFKGCQELKTKGNSLEKSYESAMMTVQTLLG